MAPTITAGTFAGAQKDKLLRHLSIQVGRTIQSCGVDEVHDLRVAIRRFSRVLVVLKKSFPRDEVRRIRGELKTIRSRAGNVRDLDVAAILLDKIADPSSAPEDIAVELRSQREQAALALTASLGRWVRGKSASDWRAALKPLAGTARAVGLATSVLPAMATQHFRRGEEAAQGKVSVRKLHRFRIAAKKLRYTLDLFEPLYGSSLAGLIEQLKGVQNLLGEINDCAMLRRMLLRRKPSPRDSDVAAALRERVRKKQQQFRERYGADFSSAAALDAWKDRLGKAPTTGKRRPS